MCGPKSESGLSGESPGRGRGLADAGGWSPEGRYFPGPFSSCFLADPAGFLGETGGGVAGWVGRNSFSLTAQGTARCCSLGQIALLQEMLLRPRLGLLSQVWHPEPQV